MTDRIPERSVASVGNTKVARMQVDGRRTITNHAPRLKTSIVSLQLSCLMQLAACLVLILLRIDDNLFF